jgi:hypothetical protein
VVLGVAIGWTLESFAGLRGAMVFGLLAGMLGANLVPLGPGCSGGDR